MHPSELKIQALVAAAKAKREGFTETAKAMKLLAEACALAAQDLKESGVTATWGDRTGYTRDGARLFDVMH
jgi:hypothetical protein